MPALTPQPTFLLPNFPGPYQEKIKIFNENGKSEQIPAIRHSRCKTILETQAVEYLDNIKSFQRVKNLTISSIRGSWTIVNWVPASHVSGLF